MVDVRDSAWRSRAPGPHRNTARQAMDGLWTEVCGQQKQSNDPRNNQHNPQYANYWAPLTRKRHIPPHPAQPRHTNDGAPRTRKRHQQEHRPQWPTERSDPTQHAKGRTGDCPGPRKGATTRRNVTQGAHRALCPRRAKSERVWTHFPRWVPRPPSPFLWNPLPPSPNPPPSPQVIGASAAIWGPTRHASSIRQGNWCSVVIRPVPTATR